jgi:hypothetical protein
MEEWSLRVSEPPTDRRNGGMVGYSVPKVHRNGGIVINLAIYPPTNRRNGGMVGYSVPKVHRNGGIVINLAIYPPTDRRNGGMVKNCIDLCILKFFI